MARTFKYGDNTYEDPGEEFSVDDVKKHLTTYFPELAQAVSQEKKLENDDVEITFVKKAGTKGADNLPQMAGDAANRRSRIFLEITKERDWQDANRGAQENDLITWVALLTEEVGEFAKAVLNQQFDVPRGSGVSVRMGAIQVAAVATAIVEYLDSHQQDPTDDYPRTEGMEAG